MIEPKLRAYLSLEASTQRVLRAAFEPAAQKLVQSIAQNPSSHAHVTQCLADFDHTDALKASAPRLKELAVSALLFGASRLKPIKETSLMTDLPHDTIHNAVGQMIAIAGTKSKLLIDRDVRRLIANGAPVKQILKKSAVFACCPPAVERICKAVDDTDYPDISDAMNAVVMGTGRSLVDLAGNLMTSRLASYGFLSEAAKDNVRTYQIDGTLDDRTCPVCMYMHGKTFDVNQAKNRCFSALSTDDPDNLKSITPWPKQDRKSLEDILSMTPAEMQQRGFDLVPFHPSCRCLLVPAGSVAETIPPADKAPPNEILQALDGLKNPADRPDNFKAPLDFFGWLQNLFGGSEDTPGAVEDGPEDDTA